MYENGWSKGSVSYGAYGVWLYVAAKKSHCQLTGFVGEDRNPLWVPDGSSFYYGDLCVASGRTYCWLNQSGTKPSNR